MIMGFKKEMKDIEAQVSVLDKQIKSSAIKIKKAFKDVVDLDNLDKKMLHKYQSYLQHQVENAINFKPNKGRTETKFNK